ncbi:MAG: GHKL domain-containing protein [Deltaproteobacteria bacterium]|nr:GHKL domain-containing protein [Deltaproteobacteria bacterium]
MTRPNSSRFQRWFLIASVAFAVFVVFQLGLFSWLILRSLSQREVDRILLSAREEASDLADILARTAESQDRNLYTAVAISSKETRTLIDSVLAQRDIVEQVEVTDRDGIVVFKSQTQTTIPEAESGFHLGQGGPEFGGELKREVVESTTTWEVEEQIGDLGFLRIRIDRIELEKRVAELRTDLIKRSALIAGVTLVMLLSAYLGVWLLFRRARRLEKAAADSERMAYIGTLAAGLAHEIRNPLNSLSLNMQMLEEELNESPTKSGSSQRLLAITRNEILRLEHLATDFLSYAKSRPLERKDMLAVDLFQEAAEVLAGELELWGGQLEVIDLSEGAVVAVDPDQIKQLLLNLMKNAMAATADLSIPASIQLTAGRRANQVFLEVADNGVGMEREAREKMFDLFFSTRRGGTGLGLSIVQRIAQNHDGELEVESEPGAGARVRLLLPWQRNKQLGRQSTPLTAPA